MRSKARAAAGLGLVLCAAPAVSAKDPRVLDPASYWTLDYAGERCSLIRDFRSGNDTVRLQIDSYGSFVSFSFLLAGNVVPGARRPAGEVRYRFPADTIERERVTALLGRSGDLPALSFRAEFVSYSTPQALNRMSREEAKARLGQPIAPEPDFEKSVDRMQIEFGNGAEIELHLGEMEKPLLELRTCIDDLYRHWGIDAAQVRQLTRYPVPVLSSVRKVQRDYPRSMVFRGESAFVPVRIAVDAQGQASQCVVQVAKIEEPFRKAVCDGLAQRFSPALDASGNPIASLYQTAVVYIIGKP